MVMSGLDETAFGTSSRLCKLTGHTGPLVTSKPIAPGAKWPQQLNPSFIGKTVKVHIRIKI